MAIPELREDGWLPEGCHDATMDEIEAKFQGDSEFSPRRRQTLHLRVLLRRLAACGVKGVCFVNGSYASAKPFPRDFDLLLVAERATIYPVPPNEELQELIDASKAEESGYSIWAVPSDSPNLEALMSLVTKSRDQVDKGVLKVTI